MKKSFWNDLPRPFLALAPMAGITDSIFRQMVIKLGKPDVVFTEFVSADGLCSEGKDELLKTLDFTSVEKPIVAQVFGADPKKIYEAVRIISEFGFSGIDLNMGCPDRSVIAQRAGSDLIRDPARAQEIIMSAKQAAGEIPISVKTRLGYSAISESADWFKMLLESGLSALTVHARTTKELYRPITHWEIVEEVVHMAQNTETVIIGNGNINSYREAMICARKTGCHGVMIGRAALTLPWIFNATDREYSFEEKIELLNSHAELYRRHNPDPRSISPFKKYIAGYLSGSVGIKKIRTKIISVSSWEEFDLVIREFLN